MIDRCDVIPKWMFVHLQKLGTQILKNEINKTTIEYEKKIQEVKKKLFEESLRGKKAIDCLDFSSSYNYDMRNSFQLKKSFLVSVNEKFEKFKKPLEEEKEKRITEVKNKYSLWEEELLTGRVKRSEVEEFEI